MLSEAFGKNTKCKKISKFTFNLQKLSVVDIIRNYILTEVC